MPFTDFQTLLDALPIAALLIHEDDRIVGANAAARELLAASLTGAHFASVLRQPDLVEAVNACFNGQGPQTVRYLQSKPEGDSTYQIKAAMLEGKAPQTVLLSFEDTTQLDQASQQRRDFVANVSHELRTPLTALMGFIETLRGPARDDAKARMRFLGIMSDEATRMERLVADLLSLSRVENQERQRPREAVDLSTVARAAINTLESMAKTANVSIVSDLPQTPLMLAGDSEQLRQLVTNLLENAVKYGGQGNTVTLTAAQTKHAAALRGPAIILSLHDQGQGIDPLHIPRLTERFYRIDNHRGREVGGTGLGLAIVKHIVNRHRGRLEITSEQGQGSTFTVTLPL